MERISDFYSYLKISGEQAAQKREIALREGIHVPMFLQADVAARCNLHCQGCYKSCIHECQPERLLSIAEWDSLFREAEQLGIRFIFLSGGEPLMEREVLERAARYQDIWFLVFTNGTLLDEKYYQFFSDHTNLVPVLCLETCSDINLAKMGKSSHLYGSLMHSMDKMSQRDIVYGACVSLTKENRERVVTRGFLGSLNRKKCRGVVYLEYELEENRKRRLILDEEEREAVERELEEIQTEFSDMVFYMLPRGGKIFGRPFEQEEDVVRVASDGAIFPTLTSRESIGDLKERGLREVLKRGWESAD